MDDLNNSGSWDEVTRYSEQLKVIVDLKDYGLRALGSTCYE